MRLRTRSSEKGLIAWFAGNHVARVGVSHIGNYDNDQGNNGFDRDGLYNFFTLNRFFLVNSKTHLYVHLPMTKVLHEPGPRPSFITKKKGRITSTGRAALSAIRRAL